MIFNCQLKAKFVEPTNGAINWEFFYILPEMYLTQFVILNDKQYGSQPLPTKGGLYSIHLLINSAQRLSENTVWGCLMNYDNEDHNQSFWMCFGLQSSSIT